MKFECHLEKGDGYMRETLVGAYSINVERDNGNTVRFWYREDGKRIAVNTIFDEKDWWVFDYDGKRQYYLPQYSHNALSKITKQEITFGRNQLAQNYKASLDKVIDDAWNDFLFMMSPLSGKKKQSSGK